MKFQHLCYYLLATIYCTLSHSVALFFVVSALCPGNICPSEWGYLYPLCDLDIIPSMWFVLRTVCIHPVWPRMQRGGAQNVRNVTILFAFFCVITITTVQRVKRMEFSIILCEIIFVRGHGHGQPENERRYGSAHHRALNWIESYLSGTGERHKLFFICRGCARPIVCKMSVDGIGRWMIVYGLPSGAHKNVQSEWLYWPNECSGNEEPIKTTADEGRGREKFKWS